MQLQTRLADSPPRGGRLSQQLSSRRPPGGVPGEGDLPKDCMHDYTTALRSLSYLAHFPCRPWATPPKLQLLAMICYYFAGCDFPRAAPLFLTGQHPRTKEGFADVGEVSDVRNHINCTVGRLEEGDLGDRSCSTTVARFRH